MKHKSIGKQNSMIYDTVRNYGLFSIWSTEAVQWEDGRPWTHGTVDDRGNNNHNNRSFTIWIKKGCLITRNSKHIKTTPITAEQYLWDQLTWHTDDPPYKILKQYETLSTYSVPNNAKNRRREETYMNNHSDMQTRNTQGYTTSNVPNNWEHTGIIEQAPINGTNGPIDKTDKNINTWTLYSRISRKLDRLT